MSIWKFPDPRETSRNAEGGEVCLELALLLKAMAWSLTTMIQTMDKFVVGGHLLIGISKIFKLLYEIFYNPIEFNRDDIVLPP